jgi:hypothetical protein
VIINRELASWVRGAGAEASDPEPAQTARATVSESAG